MLVVCCGRTFTLSTMAEVWSCVICVPYINVFAVCCRGTPLQSPLRQRSEGSRSVHVRFPSRGSSQESSDSSESDTTHPTTSNLKKYFTLFHILYLMLNTFNANFGNITLYLLTIDMADRLLTSRFYLHFTCWPTSFITNSQLCGAFHLKGMKVTLRLNFRGGRRTSALRMKEEVLINHSGFEQINGKFFSLGKF